MEWTDPKHDITTESVHVSPGPSARSERIDIHVSRGSESCGGDQTTTRPRGAIKLPGRRSPHRVRGKLYRSLTLYGCPLRYEAVLEKLPKRDRQSPGERDNANLAAAHAGTGEPLPPPDRQRALGLIAQPRPGQLDQRLSCELCPSLVDAAIPADIAARVGSGAKPMNDAKCRRVSNLR